MSERQVGTTLRMPLRMSIAELSVLRALLRKGPLRLNAVTAALGGWYPFLASDDQSAEALRSLQMRGWVIKQAGLWSASPASCLPAQMLCGGLAHMLSESGIQPPGGEQLSLIISNRGGCA